MTKIGAFSCGLMLKSSWLFCGQIADADVKGLIVVLLFCCMQFCEFGFLETIYGGVWYEMYV